MAEIYTVTADNAYQFRMTPGSLAEEVGQNLMVLLLVLRGSQPLERGLGMTWNQVDRPIQQIQTDVAMELYDQVDRYEPRAEIVSVSCAGDPLSGRVIPTIKFKLREV